MSQKNKAKDLSLSTNLKNKEMKNDEENSFKFKGSRNSNNEFKCSQFSRSKRIQRTA